MKLAILHYHLNAGGVTQVVLNQLKALDQSETYDGVEVVVLHGGRDEAWPSGFPESLQRLRVSTSALPGLDYDEGQVAGGELAASIRGRLDAVGFQPAETVIQVHNPTLGKNVSLPLAIGALAETGYRWLLQIHDFAEDFRPDNFRRLESAWSHANPPISMMHRYPQASQIHYATLTGRDARILAEAGIDPLRIHRLPNPVIAGKPSGDRETARRQLALQFGIAEHSRLFLYPVRGIRRKNLGEALLWAAVGAETSAVAVTLPPENPLELRTYRRWEMVARRHGIPCFFDVGARGGLGFDENIVAADAMLTTSVAEGFGMVFLETWLRGKPLVGRRLSEITSDFEGAGVRFGRLYDRLAIPLDLLNTRQVHEEFRRQFDEVTRSFGRPPLPASEFEDAWQRLIESDTIDFAYLSTALQEALITRVSADVGAGRAILALNPPIREAVSERSIADLDAVTHNQERVRQAFSPRATGLALERALAAVEASTLGPVDVLPGSDRVLNAFLAPSRFHPLRVERECDRNRVHEIIRRRATSLAPIATGLTTRLISLDDIRAVIFDVYGTMLVSGSGDVGPADFEAAADDPKVAAFKTAWEASGLKGTGPLAEGPARLVEVIQRHHAEARAAGVEFPEVDILAVWRDVLVEMPGGAEVRDDQLEVLATEYEAAVNPVWPMPGLRDTLERLRQAGQILGIISNAQFFTPAIFPSLLDRTLQELGFSEDLIFFSYQWGRAKPGSAMFNQLVAALDQIGLLPQNALYVGNDMRNDVMPAARAGLRTALFAGDQRSLRLRSGDTTVRGIEPDIIVTELTQIAACLT